MIVVPKELDAFLDEVNSAIRPTPKPIALTTGPILTSRQFQQILEDYSTAM
jgi:hypothetical protein